MRKQKNTPDRAAVNGAWNGGATALRTVGAEFVQLEGRPGTGLEFEPLPTKGEVRAWLAGWRAGRAMKGGAR